VLFPAFPGPPSTFEKQLYPALLSLSLDGDPFGLEGLVESTMSEEQQASETRGVMVKLLATVDLGPEIEGMAGRQLRMRMVTIEPGGVFGPMHDHKDRPGTVYILRGTITDHRNGVAKDYGPGVGWPEDRNTRHWLENRGTIPAVEISVDIVRQE
jgi:quercetin dioxygenase-like cupin family protein